jgi:hypothetical protein
VTRCRIFICLACSRIIAGCFSHPDAVVEPISSCAICVQADRKKTQ